MSNQKPGKKINFKLPKNEDILKKESDVARLYKDKNYKVKKALSFKTDKDKSKLA
tara:strand:- start:35916 stop:36080 length:165 start_codon:yes stop_codon:yes gene_type:complete